MNALHEAWKIAGALQGVVSVLPAGPERELLSRIVEAIGLASEDAEQSTVPGASQVDQALHH